MGRECIFGYGCSLSNQSHCAIFQIVQHIGVVNKRSHFLEDCSQILDQQISDPNV